MNTRSHLIILRSLQKKHKIMQEREKCYYFTWLICEQYLHSNDPKELNSEFSKNCDKLFKEDGGKGQPRVCIQPCMSM